MSSCSDIRNSFVMKRRLSTVEYFTFIILSHLRSAINNLKYPSVSNNTKTEITAVTVNSQPPASGLHPPEEPFTIWTSTTVALSEPWENMLRILVGFSEVWTALHGPLSFIQFQRVAIYYVWDRDSAARGTPECISPTKDLQLWKHTRRYAHT